MRQRGTAYDGPRSTPKGVTSMQSQYTGTRLIPLSRGLWTLVDAVDWPSISEHRWYALNSGRGYYAARDTPRPRRTILMHREIVRPENRLVDHINGDTLDNRRSNLRGATRAQNGHNMGLVATNTSGYIGVSWHKAGRKWETRIKTDGVQLFLGLYDTAIEAAYAHDAAAIALHGEFARLNFPQD
jgi:hypothetical protein